MRRRVSVGAGSDPMLDNYYAVAFRVDETRDGSRGAGNCDDLRTTYTNSGRLAAAFIKHCLSVLLNDVRIGLTPGYDRLSSEPVLRNFGTGSYSSP